MNRFKVYRFLVFWIFRLLFPTKVINKERMETSGPIVVVCNHMSFVDPIMIFGYSPRDVIFLGKKELFENKFLGWALRLLRVIPVDRGHSDVDAIKKILKALKSGEAVGIFPEGKRCEEGNLGEFQTGAAMIALKGGADIQVMAYSRKLKLFRRTKLIVGPTIDLSGYSGKRTDHNAVAEVTEEIKYEMQKLIDLASE